MSRKTLVQSLVRIIVDTYDINPNLKDKIAFRANRRANELFLDSFDSIYQDIAFLMERMQVPFRERNSLDCKNNKGWSLLDELSGEDSIGGQEEETYYLQPNEIFDILGGDLESRERKILERLLSKTNSLRITYENLVRNKRYLRDRLVQIANSCWGGGRSFKYSSQTYCCS